MFWGIKEMSLLLAVNKLNYCPVTMRKINISKIIDMNIDIFMKFLICLGA